MIYWTMFDYKNEQYTIATTDEGLRFLGNDFATAEAFLQWASGKGWTDFVQDEEKLKSAIEQIKAYFNGERKEFRLALDITGTAFQQQVWQALQTVPYGETLSYSDIAIKIGREKAVRAVAAAIGANPVMIIVPCHRIIGKNGKLTGFRGGLALKQQLLELEDVIS